MLKSLLCPLGFALVALVALGCASDPSSSNGPDDGLLGDAEVTQELNGKPRYSARSLAIRGEYKAPNDQGCPNGSDVCERIVVHRENEKTWFEFGYYDRYDRYWENSGEARVWSENGVVLFTTGEINDDCDDPGCGNFVTITGVIYPVKVGDEWEPRMKVHYTLAFPFPDEPDAPEGIVKRTIRLHRETQP
jgi:hypothetical protein